MITKYLSRYHLREYANNVKSRFFYCPHQNKTLLIGWILGLQLYRDRINNMK